MYECIDCPAGIMTRNQARSHFEIEGHCIVEEEEDE